MAALIEKNLAPNLACIEQLIAGKQLPKRDIGNILTTFDAKGSSLSLAKAALISSLASIPYSNLQPAVSSAGALLEDGGISSPVESCQTAMIWILLGVIHNDRNLKKAALQHAYFLAHFFWYQESPLCGIWQRATQFCPYEWLSALKALFLMAFYLTEERHFFDRASELAKQLSVSLRPQPNFSDQLLSLFKEVISAQSISPMDVVSHLEQAEEASLGALTFRDQGSVSLFALSGDNSGLGSWLHGSSGVLCFGPQLGSLDHLPGFGIGRKDPGFRDLLSKKEQHGITLKGWSRLFAKSSCWFEATLSSLSNQGTVTINLHQEPIPNQLSLVFYIRACELKIHRGKTIQRRSLDGYQGAATLLECMGESNGFKIDPLAQKGEMRIIPLAGERHFWGADYLISFSINQAAVSVHFGLL